MDMKYTLITPTGKIYTFHIQALAQTYLGAYGGTLVDASVEMAVDTPTVGKVIPTKCLT
jgi:hypothetical protein